MMNIGFSLFIENNPEFTDKWQELYFNSLVYSSPPMHQHGFLASHVSTIKSLIKVKRPVSILCGSQKSYDNCIAKLPVDLHSLIQINTWYDADIYVIMEQITK